MSSREARAVVADAVEACMLDLSSCARKTPPPSQIERGALSVCEVWLDMGGGVSGTLVAAELPWALFQRQRKIELCLDVGAEACTRI